MDPEPKLPSLDNYPLPTTTSERLPQPCAQLDWVSILALYHIFSKGRFTSRKVFLHIIPSLISRRGNPECNSGWGGLNAQPFIYICRKNWQCSPERHLYLQTKAGFQHVSLWCLAPQGIVFFPRRNPFATCLHAQLHRVLLQSFLQDNRNQG